MPTTNTPAVTDVELSAADVDRLIAAFERISASVTEAIAILEAEADPVRPAASD